MLGTPAGSTQRAIEIIHSNTELIDDIVGDIPLCVYAHGTGQPYPVAGFNRMTIVTDRGGLIVE
jgi:hypothetical protein